MKVAVSASSADLGGSVDPRFGRCLYFLFVDPETMEFEALENPYVHSTSGSGIQAAQFVADHGAEAVLTGSCGPNAFQVLKAAGVDVFIGITGSVQDAVRQYASGEMRSAPEPNVPSHFGMGMGMGQGFGRGRGMGLGPGRGRGMGPGRDFMGSSQPSPTQPLAPDEELQFLKQQAENLRQQMEFISKRIKDLEKKK